MDSTNCVRRFDAPSFEDHIRRRIIQGALSRQPPAWVPSTRAMPKVGPMDGKWAQWMVSGPNGWWFLQKGSIRNKASTLAHHIPKAAINMRKWMAPPLVHPSHHKMISGSVHPNLREVQSHLGHAAVDHGIAHRLAMSHDRMEGENRGRPGRRWRGRGGGAGGTGAFGVVPCPRRQKEMAWDHPGSSKLSK